MLTDRYRMHSRREFVETRRKGKRVVSGGLVFHVLKINSSEIVERFGGPRFGLTVGKNVGNSVVRHGVSRKLRAECAEWVDKIPTDCQLVITVRGSQEPPSKETLAKDFGRAMSRVYKHCTENASCDD